MILYVLRQLGSTLLTGAETSEAATPDVRHQITDVNPRYILQLAASGKISWGQTALAANGSLSLPLPQTYVVTNNLHMAFTSDQIVKVATTGVNGTSAVMIRAGINQVGVLTQCGPVASITVTGNTISTANLEWFLFELPNILSVTGWRDGSLATGTQAP